MTDTVRDQIRNVWRRSRPLPETRPDPADHGTAFGLDLSMEPEASTTPQAPPASASRTDASPPAWWTQLTARRTR